MNPVRILIVEDEAIISEDLSEGLMTNGYEVCGIARSFGTAKEFLNKHEPDLVLLDIKISGDQDGIDLARLIRSDYEIPFLFISSYSDSNTVSRAKDVNPYGYIIKPFEDEDVLVAIEIALGNFAREQDKRLDDFILNDSIFVKDRNLVVKVPFKEIKYICADGNYSTIRTVNRSYVLRATLKDIATKIPSNSFYRSHKSYIINLKSISAINSESIYIEGERLPIGRSQQHDLMERINKI
ncbi:MAG: LytTR family transcriptional regulator DNA-binding domain-containing protein [Bacteroidota bacterium]